MMYLLMNTLFFNYWKFRNQVAKITGPPRFAITGPTVAGRVASQGENEGKTARTKESEGEKERNWTCHGIRLGGKSLKLSSRSPPPRSWSPRRNRCGQFHRFFKNYIQFPPKFSSFCTGSTLVYLVFSLWFLVELNGLFLLLLKPGGLTGLVFVSFLISIGMRNLWNLISALLGKRNLERWM